MNWVILLALPALALGQCFSENDTLVETGEQTQKSLTKGQQIFSLELLRTLNTLKPGQNIFFSPHSIYQTLLLAYFAAGNATEEEIQMALHLPETQQKVEVLDSYRKESHFQEMREFNGSSAYSYRTANRMFVAKDLPLKECVSSALLQELESIDFKGDAAAALNHINDWVANITNNHIKDLIPPNGVHEDTKLVLANAAYFKGLWKYKFLASQTEKNVLFYKSTSEYGFVDMMSQKGNFNYIQSERLKSHILELPYKGGDVSMIIILPRYDDNSIDDLIKSLTDEALLEILDFEAFFPRPLEVKIPKFVIEEEIDLKGLFSEIGLKNMFNNGSDFTTLTGKESGIFFNDAIHKARVEVDEEGTEAAAATAVFSFRSSRPLEPTIFIADHPFVYLIFDKASQNILFLGAFRNPAKKEYPKKFRARF